MDKKGRKLLSYAIGLFSATFLIGYLILSDTGLRVFNLVFGNNVYVLEIKCTPSPDYQMGKIIGVYFRFDIRLFRDRIPVEAVLTGHRVVELESQNIEVVWRLHIFVYVLNRARLFDRTLFFDNLNPKLVYVYLRVPSEARQVYVEMDGAYVLEDEEITFSGYGGAFALEP